MPTNHNSPKNVIIDLVNENPGIKATQLVADFVNTWMVAGNAAIPDNIADTLVEMVKDGDITEVEYILPTMSYRVKSLYFPKGTKITLISPEIGIPDDRQIKNDEELFCFLDLITSLNITPAKDPHAGTKNGKDLIRVKSVARKISDYLKAKVGH